jgi:dolichyl-diphosphooligosaccharide--protein glycosyltransferase
MTERSASNESDSASTGSLGSEVSAGWPARIVTGAALFLSALAVRALPAPTVLLDDGVQPFGGDAFYHLRRIAYALERFPDTLRFDPYLNYPTGANAIWTPAFDLGIAAVASVFGAGAASPEMERIAVWVPPLLGAAAAVALYGLTARLFGEWTGRLAGAIACVMSGHFWYSQIGFVDHHAAVSLVSTALLGTGLACLSRPQGAGWLRAGGLGLAIAASLWIWPGTVLHIGIVELVLGVVLVFGRIDSRRAGLEFSFVQLVALGLLGPAAASANWPQWSAFSPVVLSTFHIWFFSALGAVGLAVAAVPRERSFPLRATVASAAALGVALVSSWAWPELRVGGADALQWFGRDERFQSMVSESMPLFVVRGAWSWDVAMVRLSPFLFVAPFALLAMARAARKHPAPRAIALLVVWTSVLLLATLFQKRFFNSSSLALCVLMAWTLGRAVDWTVLSTRASPRTARTACCLLAGIVLAPVLWSYRGFVGNWFERDAIDASARQLEQNVAISMARTLRRSTPPTRGWLDASLRPEYGVLAPWPFGHVIEYVARRPSVTSGFGDDVGRENFESARHYYLGDERGAVAIAEVLGVRFVVAQRSPKFLGEAADPDAMSSALFERDGSAAGSFAALARHRMHFESAPPGRRDRNRESLFKVFEIVDGALLVGRAFGAESVDVQLGLTTNRDRRFQYRTAARVARDGRFQLVVPYATGASGVMTSEPNYVVSCGAISVAVEVTEPAVQGESRIAVPTLRCAGAG